MGPRRPWSRRSLRGELALQRLTGIPSPLKLGFRPQNVRHVLPPTCNVHSARKADRFATDSSQGAPLTSTVTPDLGETQLVRAKPCKTLPSSLDLSHQDSVDTCVRVRTTRGTQTFLHTTRAWPVQFLHPSLAGGALQQTNELSRLEASSVFAAAIAEHAQRVRVHATAFSRHPS